MLVSLVKIDGTRIKKRKPFLDAAQLKRALEEEFPGGWVQKRKEKTDLDNNGQKCSSGWRLCCVLYGQHLLSLARLLLGCMALQGPSPSSGAPSCRRRLSAAADATFLRLEAVSFRVAKLGKRQCQPCASGPRTRIPVTQAPAAAGAAAAAAAASAAAAAAFGPSGLEVRGSGGLLLSSVMGWLVALAAERGAQQLSIVRGTKALQRHSQPCVTRRLSLLTMVFYFSTPSRNVP